MLGGSVVPQASHLISNRLCHLAHTHTLALRVWLDPLFSLFSSFCNAVRTVSLSVLILCVLVYVSIVVLHRLGMVKGFTSFMRSTGVFAAPTLTSYPTDPTYPTLVCQRVANGRQAQHRARRRLSARCTSSHLATDTPAVCPQTAILL